MRDIELRYKDIRKDKCLLQKDIAKALNILEDTYSKYERGLIDMPLELCNKLADFYNVSLDYLLGISDVYLPNKNKKIDLNLLHERLKTLRKENKLTQVELSKKVGFPQTTYSNYENGNSIPTTLKLYYIAIFYNVSLDYLVGKTNQKSRL